MSPSLAPPRIDKSLAELAINTLRTLAIDAIQKANSGHPGLPMGAAPMAYILWQNHLRHDPKHPNWPDRDRFVLSGGHGSMLLYGLLHLAGYDLAMDELQNFRQWESKTPGHPEFRLTPGVEATTGPLGQGATNSVGMAIAERALAHRFNRPGHTIVDHTTYALVSDGDIMEGVCAEAASLAGHLHLGKLIWLYDANDITLDGPAEMAFSEDVGKRFEAYGWQVLHVPEGNEDLEGLDAAIRAARGDAARPTLIVVKTTIGYGSPGKSGTSEIHGSPLGEEEVRLTKKTLNWDPEKHFFVPDRVLAHFRTALEKGCDARADWTKRFETYRKDHSDLAAEFERRCAGELPDGWALDIPTWGPEKSLATRDAGGKVLNAIAKRLPELLGGDADLSCSTKTLVEKEGDFDGATGAGRNIRFGIREHAMAGIANGMSYHGGVRPYVATFLTFSDYMRPSIRLAAMNHLPVIYVFTHDSIGLGEDGPTHQAVEHYAALRSIPNLTVFRPGDANETAEAWQKAILHRTGPVALLLTRQKVPTIDRKKCAPAAGTARGGYILAEASAVPPRAILLATGSEVSIALAAREILENDGIPARVVSLPSWEIFASEPQVYRDEVLPPEVTARLAIEVGVSLGWHRWVGDRGEILALDRFGASAPYEIIYEKLGFTPENAAKRLRRLAK